MYRAAGSHVHGHDDLRRIRRRADSDDVHRAGSYRGRECHRYKPHGADLHSLLLANLDTRRAVNLNRGRVEFAPACSCTAILTTASSPSLVYATARSGTTTTVDLTMYVNETTSGHRFTPSVARIVAP